MSNISVDDRQPCMFPTDKTGEYSPLQFQTTHFLGNTFFPGHLRAKQFVRLRALPLPTRPSRFNPPVPLSRKYGTYKTVTARSRPWLAGTRPENLLSCCLFARKRFWGSGVQFWTIKIIKNGQKWSKWSKNSRAACPPSLAP